MENMPNDKESGLHNAEIADLKNTLENHTREIEETLRIAGDELSGAAQLLEICQSELEQIQNENEWIKRNQKLAEILQMKINSEEELNSIKQEIQQHEVAIQKFKSFVSSFTQYKAIFQGQIDELAFIEKAFKASLTNINPENLQ